MEIGVPWNCVRCVVCCGKTTPAKGREEEFGPFINWKGVSLIGQALRRGWFNSSDSGVREFLHVSYVSKGVQNMHASNCGGGEQSIIVELKRDQLLMSLPCCLCSIELDSYT